MRIKKKFSALLGGEMNLQRLHTMSYHLIVAGFCQAFHSEEDSLWKVVFKTIH